MPQGNACAVPWLHGEAAIAVNPAKRKRVAAALLSVVIAVFLSDILLDERGPLMPMVRTATTQQRTQALEPTMRKLADSGSPEAALWMAKQFPQTEASRLDSLIRAGSGEAAWTLALLKWKSDNSEARRLLRVAAQAGFAPAVEYAQSQTTR